MEIGESLEQTAIREVKEETNLDIEKLKLVNTFSGKNYFFTLENKDQIYVVTSLYRAKRYSGTMIPDGTETKELKFFLMKTYRMKLRMNIFIIYSFTWGLYMNKKLYIFDFDDTIVNSLPFAFNVF
ncbi:NUDIX domain-containing protein [Enterococcus sp. DIV0086]|uniref:NUDIX domain-containing protein n=1 Tax=Enterococcus sp. DIV0086 TaxID=2774655 RepID=UPI003D2A0C82